MGRKLHYRPGSFYRVDDRTGFVQRAERTRQEWNGQIVDERVWEARQPQDLVRGVRDNQSVPQARPISPNAYVGPIAVLLSQPAGPGAMSLSVDSTAELVSGTMVGVVLANGEVFRTTLVGAANGIANIFDPLPSAAAAGAELIDYPAPGNPLVRRYILDGNGALVLDQGSSGVLEG